MKNKFYIISSILALYSVDSIASAKSIIKFVSDIKTQRVADNISNRLDSIISSNEDLMQSKLQQRDTIVKSNKAGAKFSNTDIDTMMKLNSEYKKLKAQNESLEEFRDKVSDLNTLIKQIRDNKDAFDKAASSKSISKEQLATIKDLFDQLDSMQSKKFDAKSALKLLEKIENNSEIIENFKNDFSEYIKTQKEINRSRTSTDNLMSEISNKSIDNRSVISEEPDTVTTENPLYRRRRAASEDTQSVRSESNSITENTMRELEELGEPHEI